MGRPLLGWTLQAFAGCSSVHDIIVSGGESDLPRLREIGTTFGGGKVRDVVLGGADRQASVRNGLAACSDAEYIIVHDGARPCVTPALIEQVLEAASYVLSNATAALSVSDTLVKSLGDRWYDGPNGSRIAHVGARLDRENVWAVQTPQAFKAQGLREAHNKAAEAGFVGTDDTAVWQWAFGTGGYLVTGSPENIKVTRPEDLVLVAAVLAGRQQASPPTPLPEAGRGNLQDAGQTKDERFADASPTQAPPPLKGKGAGGRGLPAFRIGYGYDVHPFAPASENRTLYIGGVAFPEAERGLAGHSDADVLLHALCDALLGAAGMGDIGQLFPPSDNRHKNRASIEFLQEVAARLKNDGWQIANVDMTVIAEAPKINPRVDDMKCEIGVVLGIGPGQVGIKATTSEGLGFVGRGEGIAAHATALLMRP